MNGSAAGFVIQTYQLRGEQILQVDKRIAVFPWARVHVLVRTILDEDRIPAQIVTRIGMIRATSGRPIHRLDAMQCRTIPHLTSGFRTNRAAIAVESDIDVFIGSELDFMQASWLT